MTERPDRAAAVRRMLEPRSVAVVGASARPGSFGQRLATEVLRSPAAPRVHLVHPSHTEVLGRPCLPSLAAVPEPVDLVLLGVGDRAVTEQVALAAKRGDGGAVVFGSASGLDTDVATAAAESGMPLCGPGCMGFVNLARGIRAIGYLERDALVPGPIALVTHSGSVFSALLRTHRRLEYSVAVSSGREVVTTAADYLGYALDLPETRVVGLFLETMRDVPLLRSGLARAAAADVPVVALTVGSSPVGREMVGAHSGALAGEAGAWEALFAEYGVHAVRDLDELADTLEVFAVGRRLRPRPETGRRRGIATLHDSGGERALTADLADSLAVPFAELGAGTLARLAGVLEEGMTPANPLDVWGTGAETEDLVTACLTALDADDAVDVTALAVDLVEEYDGDDSYPRAVLRTHARTDKPVVVLSALAASVDQAWAWRLRAAGVPVLEGLPSGLRALGHLRAAAHPPLPAATVAVDTARRTRWRTRLAAGPLGPADVFALLADYGLDVAVPAPAGSAAEACAEAGRLGYPVVLKTAADGVHHKADVGGVVVGLADAEAVATAYAELADRLGPRVLVQPMAAPGVELALGVVRDPALGPLVVVAAGGTLVELVRRRAVALPPLDRARAERVLDGVPLLGTLLAGARGQGPVDRSAVVAAITGVGRLAHELGDRLDALDVNPLVCTPNGAVAVDALLLPRSPTLDA
ncbi:MAG: acetate--CoA ligase family protein [Nocardioidaceae bacterium]